jgi:hypothetical protein
MLYGKFMRQMKPLSTSVLARRTGRKRVGLVPFPTYAVPTGIYCLFREIAICDISLPLRDLSNILRHIKGLPLFDPEKHFCDQYFIQRLRVSSAVRTP